MQIENKLVTNCSNCAKDCPEPTEPLMSSSFPSRPWERLAADLFELAGKVYLIVVDYYSRWFEIRRLNDQSSSRVISVLKELFSTHGIPDIIVSYNGPQFSSDAFRLFTTEYDFIHVTSSPKYSRANGEFERAVRMVKAPHIPISSPPCLPIYTIAEWFFTQRVAHGAPPTRPEPGRSDLGSHKTTKVLLSED